MLQKQKISQLGLKFEGSWNYDTTNKFILYVILPLPLLTILPVESGLGSLLKRESKLFISRGGSRISKGGVDGRPYLLRGGRENANFCAKSGGRRRNVA